MLESVSLPEINQKDHVEIYVTESVVLFSSYRG